VIGIAGDFGRFAMKRVARQADNTEQSREPFLCSLLGPIECGALRVGINEGDAAAFAGLLAGEMKRQRGLADAALLVEERDDHDAALDLVGNGRIEAAAWSGERSPSSRSRLFPFPAGCGSHRVFPPPTTERLESWLDSKLRGRISIFCP
jgi:hypothetical protein